MSTLSDVAANLQAVRNSLPEGVRLVAVSKFHPAEYIREAYNAGQRVFGESREQELAKKVEELPNDIEWHFIGHLQTNKVKYIAPYIHMIEAVPGSQAAAPRRGRRRAAQSGWSAPPARGGWPEWAHRLQKSRCHGI